MQIQPIDITQIIVAIITATAIVLAAVINNHFRRRQQKEHELKNEPQKLKDEPRKINIWKIVMCICLILLVANLVVFGLRYCGTTTEVGITYPYNNATVEIKEMVEGTSQNIPEGQVIWIIVYPYLVDRYYPYNEPADIQANGEWASLVGIGIKEDAGKKFKFDIIAVLANEEAQDEFNIYFTQAIWGGIEKLPKGALIYDRVTVTRK